MVDMNAVPGPTKDIDPGTHLTEMTQKQGWKCQFLDCKKDTAYVFCKFATVNPLSEAEKFMHSMKSENQHFCL